MSLNLRIGGHPPDNHLTTLINLVIHNLSVHNLILGHLFEHSELFPMKVAEPRIRVVSVSRLSHP